MTKENEFIESLEGELTPEQVEQLLHGGEQGETSEELDAEGSVPNTDNTNEGGNEQEGNSGGEQESEEAEQEGNAETEEGKQQEINEEELNAENAAILARDGKHLISYDKLAEARQLAQQERHRAEQAMQELERLRQEAQQRADEGKSPTQQDNQSAVAEAAIEAGVDPDLFGDFSEEALAKGIEKLVAQQVEQRVEKRLSEALQPIQQREQHSATEAHYNAIYEAHPDADSIAESQELADWIASQPSFTQSAMQQVLQSGSTEQVIELFSAFKSATHTEDTTQQKTEVPKSKEEEIKEAAKKKLKSQKAPVPASLSQFPAGKSVTTDRTDAMADMGGVDLVNAMDDMTPEQIEAFMNRL